MQAVAGEVNTGHSHDDFRFCFIQLVRFVVLDLRAVDAVPRVRARLIREPVLDVHPVGGPIRGVVQSF